MGSENMVQTTHSATTLATGEASNVTNTSVTQATRALQYLIRLKALTHTETLLAKQAPVRTTLVFVS